MERSPFPDGELETAVELGVPEPTTVRAWVRSPSGEPATGRLLVDGREPIDASVVPSASSDWTGVLEFRLDEPCPDQPFVVTVGERELHGRLPPAQGSATALTFGFGSCNRPFEVGAGGAIHHTRAARMYEAVADSLGAIGARFMLLAGDQIYSDELSSISIRDELPGDEQHPPDRELAVEAYRRISRGYLGQRSFVRLREALPTACIWDDHDIFDNWGSRLEKTPLDRLLFDAAAQVYGEYQHGRNPGPASSSPPYYFSFRWGNVGFSVLDVRGARDYPAGELLGAEQWSAFREYLSGAATDGISTLCVVSSIPIAHVSRWLAQAFAWMPGDGGNQVRDRWCSPAFVAQRDALLEALFDWQRAVPGRQVLLLSGDVHAASAFTIRERHGDGVIQQFTSSALTTEHTKEQRALNSIAVRWPNVGESKFRFQRHFLVHANNVGIVQLEPLPDGGHRVRFEVRAWHAESQELRPAAEVVSSPTGAVERRSTRRWK